MTAFSQLVQEWQTFYATLAAASATLVGLLFVALAVSPNTLLRTNTRGIQLLARETFTSFIYVIAIALTFLVPRAEPVRLGISLAAIGVFGVLITLRALRILYNRDVSADERRSGLRRSLSNLVSLGLLIVIGAVLAFMGFENALWWMIAPMLILLMTASLNTWVLLIAIQQASNKD